MSTVDTEAVMAQLRAEAAAAGMSIVDLARHSKTSRSSLDLYLKGTRQMPLEVLYRIADVLDVEPATILSRAQERQANR